MHCNSIELSLNQHYKSLYAYDGEWNTVGIFRHSKERLIHSADGILEEDCAMQLDEDGAVVESEEL